MAITKNYDSEFCGNVPLHNVNLIQDYGYLLILNAEDFSVIQASENITDITNLPLQELIGNSILNYAPEFNLDKLKLHFDGDITDKIPVSIAVNKTELQGLVHKKDGYFIFELEKMAADDARYFSEVFQEIKYAMVAIEHAQSIEEVSKTAVSEIKKIIGFDGVMMYRFDEDWNGTVIAEEKTGDLENYIGFTFPASDIPRQARQMYLKSPYRIIPNRNYTPVRLYPVINPVTNTFVDLSDCNLRSVAAVHIEYLKNMNVAASMSIRVTHNNKLWGLIACHNVTPCYLNFELRSVCELLSSIISNKITFILNKEKFEAATSLQHKQNVLMEQIYAEGDVIDGLLAREDVTLEGMFNAGGVIIQMDGRVEVTGNVPGADSFENLTLWLQGKNNAGVYATDSLSTVYDEAAEYADVGSGILVIPLDNDKGEYIIFFRPEIIQVINWGGNPDNAITFTNDGKNYHPRNSFKLWQQTVRAVSQGWQSTEVEAAETLRSFIFEFRTRQMHA